MNTSSQVDLLYKAMKRGKTLTWINGLQIARTSKTSTRMGELEKKYGVTLDRGWRKLEGTQVRTYRLAR